MLEGLMLSGSGMLSETRLCFPAVMSFVFRRQKRRILMLPFLEKSARAPLITLISCPLLVPLVAFLWPGKGLLFLLGEFSIITFASPWNLIMYVIMIPGCSLVFMGHVHLMASFSF
jgi:hypothetical protein